jgi:hypothetical protein
MDYSDGDHCPVCVLFASVFLGLLIIERFQNNIQFPVHLSSSPCNWVSSYCLWFDAQHPDGSEAHPATCLLGTAGCFYRGKNVQGIRLRMSGAVPPFLHMHENVHCITLCRTYTLLLTVKFLMIYLLWCDAMQSNRHVPRFQYERVPFIRLGSSTHMTGVLGSFWNFGTHGVRS